MKKYLILCVLFTAIHYAVVHCAGMVMFEKLRDARYPVDTPASLD